MPSVQDKQSPYVGYFRGNGSRTAPRLFEPNSHPHVGVYRHAPASTTSKGLQEILRDKRTSLKPKSVMSTLQLFNLTTLPKHLEKKTLELMPTSHFHRDQGGEETPMCPICLENFIDGDEIRNLKCDHCFHKSCIDVWLLGTMSSDVTTTVCPTCRQDASSVITEPETGSGVYSSSECPAPISTIPAECFLRVGQFLLHEGSKSKNTSQSAAQHSPTASPPIPLPPIAASRSPPLPPLLSLPPPLAPLTIPSPSSAAFFFNRTPSPSSNSSSSNSNSPSNSVNSSSSSTLPTMFFPALDDESRSHLETYTASNDDDEDNAINYHILANRDDECVDMSCSFMTVNISDVEEEKGKQ